MNDFLSKRYDLLSILEARILGFTPSKSSIRKMRISKKSLHALRTMTLISWTMAFSQIIIYCKMVFSSRTTSYVFLEAL